MILAITPNPALDVTYTLEHLEVGETHRIYDVQRRPGGKGINVANVLHTLGEPVTASGFMGTGAGDDIRRMLTIPQAWIDVPVPTRTSVAIVHDGVATVLNEAGHPVDATHWTQLADVVAAASPGDVVVVSGSTPPGTDPHLVATLVRAARKAGARCIVDTSGPALLSAAEAGADLLKPNAREALAATGAATVPEAVGRLLEVGASAVVVSLGEAGMALTVSDGRTWSASPTEVLAGNPTGAGDAAVAALARALRTSADPESFAAALPDAVALSGAAVLRPVAGEVDLEAYERMRTLITVEETHATR